MKKLVVLFSILMIVTLSSCTKNQRAKTFGGTIEIKMETGKKLVNATWKGDELWYLVRDRTDGEEIEKFEFIEESSFGLVEGRVIFIER